MTVEEIEIIVTAKVEEALKEFQKIMPELQKAMKQAQEAFSKVDTKAMTNKFHQAANFMKKKMQDLKKSSENNEIAIKVNNKDAQKQITQIEKEIDSLQKKITGRQLKLDVTNNALDKIRNDTNQSVIKEMPEAGNKQIKQETYKKLDNNTNYQSLVKQSDKLNNEIEKYNALLNSAKSKMEELGQQTLKTSTTQNKLSSFFGGFKQKVEQAKPGISKIKDIFSKLPAIGQNFSKVTQNINNHIKNMGVGFKSGLGHILKYAGALFSLQSIYSTLSGCASKWLSSQNAGAKQLSANIDYMKYAMGSAFAPVIQYVTNLVYQLMKAIQSVVYALFKVNIFANASAKSYASMAGSAKKASKETNKMADIDEIHNIQKDSDSSGGSGSGGSTPSFDLSNIDTQMSVLSQKLYNFFKPLVDSWNKYGAGLIAQLKTTAGQVTELISTVWGSFEKIITNGTVYKTLELILAIIGDIAEAFANAWKYNGNGDAIIQNLANALNNLLTAIDNVVKSEKFQDWLNKCSDKFRIISEKIAEIDWQPLINALSDIGENLGTLALDILNGLVDIFKWFIENPIVAEIILGIAIAIKVIAAAINIYTTAMAIYKAIMQIAAVVSTEFGISIGWLIVIIIAIIAVIALIVVAIMNWDTVIKALKDTWDWIKEKAEEIWNKIAEFFSNLWGKIKQKAVDIWDSIKTKISDVMSNIKVKITNVMNTIRGVWDSIWTTIGNVVKNIWNGIWGTIKGVINKILGGIESFVNGTIKGINILLKGIEGLANAVGSVLGFNSITLQLNEVSLPRLAKGGVLTEATAVIAGEYSGAKSNPEIVTPQNIMAETMRNVLKERNSNSDTINFVNELKVNGKTFAREIIQDLNDEAKRLGYKPILERG